MWQKSFPDFSFSTRLVITLQHSQVTAFREIDGAFFLLDGGTYRGEKHITVVQFPAGVLHD